MLYSGIHQIELVLILLLFLVVGFGALAKRIELPYPIVLVIAGLVMSLIPGIPRVSLHPDVVFLAILPPLLFGAAFSTSWRGFPYNLVSIAFLAFGLVGFIVFGVALVALLVSPDFRWGVRLVIVGVVCTITCRVATS